MHHSSTELSGPPQLTTVGGTLAPASSKSGIVAAMSSSWIGLHRIGSLGMNVDRLAAGHQLEMKRRPTPVVAIRHAEPGDYRGARRREP